MSLFSSNDIGIDLGTANTLVCIGGKVYVEPSVIAIDTDTNRAVAFGVQAKNYIGRAHDKIRVVRPIRKGFISDYTNTQKMIEYFIKKAVMANGHSSIRKPRVVAAIPSEATEVEKKAVWDAIEAAGARQIEIMEEPLCAALGVDINVKKPEGNMIIDIGGGTSDVAIVSLGGLVCAKSIKIGGDDFDEAIIKYLREKHQLIIGERMAEDVKINIGSASEIPFADKKIAYTDEEDYVKNSEKNIKEKKYTVKGLHMITGYPKTVEITESEIRNYIEEPVSQIIRTIKSVFEITPPELAADIYTKGIVMTGGGSQLTGLVERIKAETQIEAILAENPVGAVIRGIQKHIFEMEHNKN